MGLAWWRGFYYSLIETDQFRSRSILEPHSYFGNKLFSGIFGISDLNVVDSIPVSDGYDASKWVLFRCRVP
jgi:hypothetical protein